MEDGAPSEAGLDPGALALTLAEGSVGDPSLAGVELMGTLPDDEPFHDGLLKDGRLDEGSPNKVALSDDDFVCFENDEVDFVVIDGSG